MVVRPIAKLSKEARAPLRAVHHYGQRHAVHDSVVHSSGWYRRGSELGRRLGELLECPISWRVVWEQRQPTNAHGEVVRQWRQRVVRVQYAAVVGALVFVPLGVKLPLGSGVVTVPWLGRV